MNTGKISDGFHTFDELYEFRLLYHAHAARYWVSQGWAVTKSWRHSDGEKCFGGGWFIVTAQLPSGQISNHYPSPDWDLFKDIEEVELAPEWDGHEAKDVTSRLRLALNSYKDCK